MCNINDASIIASGAAIYLYYLQKLGVQRSLVTYKLLSSTPTPFPLPSKLSALATASMETIHAFLVVVSISFSAQYRVDR